MKLNSNSTNNIKKSKEKNKIFNFENINNNNKINNNTNNHKIKIENQNSSFNNSIKNIWSQLNEKKKYINLKDKVFSKSKLKKLSKYCLKFSFKLFCIMLYFFDINWINVFN